MTRTLKTWAVAAGVVALAGAAKAGPVFQGRLADGTASNTCTVSGATKCTSFYDGNLNITILNNWTIGTGTWSATAAAGSAQAKAEAAGLGATGLTGWVLPTDDGSLVGGKQNQFLSIWNDVGQSFAGLQAQFDSVQASIYWSDTVYAPNTNAAWYFYTYNGQQNFFSKTSLAYAVAVRAGDVVATVPEPQTLALVLLGLGAVVATRKRPS